MTREQAMRLVVWAARKVSKTCPEKYTMKGQYERLLAERLARLRRAIRDLDEAEEEGEEETEEEGQRSWAKEAADD